MEAKPAKTPVSSHIRPKVKAFQFIEGRPSIPQCDDGADKENVAVQTSYDEQEENAAPNKICPPSTPATRLPLVDLIGNPEESSKRRKPNSVTPEEHVLWQHSISFGKSQPTVTPVGKRKRARSSSPASSSQRETSNFFPTRASGQRAQQLLKIPQGDPAADLWQRYRTNVSGNDTSIKGNDAIFAHLIKEASPRSTTDAGSVSRMRRWVSCGVEWPTSESKSKRRRTDAGSRKAPDQQSAIHSEVEEEGKRSKVDVLLELMKETLSKENHREPSSSSPLPAAGSTDATSPLERLGTAAEELHETPCRAPGGHRVQGPPVPQKAQSSFSEYSDAEIDMEILQVIDCAEKRTGPHTQIISMQRSSSAEANQNSNAYQQDLDDGKFEDFVSDEFGGDDDDIFTADLELLVAKYDSQPQPQPSCSTAVGAKDGRAEPEAQILSFEDEFGIDAIDMEQFTAAEAAATQSLMAADQSFTSVCPLRYSVQTIY